jgi:hypothetical protein
MFHKQVRLFLVITAALIGDQAFGAEQAKQARSLITDRNTTILVKGIHCEFCARKLAGTTSALPEVKTTKVDVKKGLVLIIPKDAGRLPTPRAQWDAVRKAGYQPLKLHGPFGQFNSPPPVTVGTASAPKVAEARTPAGR